MGKPCPVAIGEKWGRLTILKFVGVRKRKRMFGCRCDCGRVKVASGQNLASGVTRSCGCLAREMVGRLAFKHGLTNTPTWNSWRAMNKRCHAEGSSDYYLYGARGIRVCERWRRSFENFATDMGERPDGATLDRVDVDGAYEPANCRWATPAEQAANRRCVRLDAISASQIRWLRIDGQFRVEQIAQAFDVAVQTVNDVVSGRSWRPA